MSRLKLPAVTLCAIDTRCPALAAQALSRSMAAVDFARAVLFTNDWQPTLPCDGIELVDIGPLHSGEDYSRFVLRQLPLHIQTPHVLVTQWDGFVIDARAWQPQFLDWDYIGAVWPDQPAAACVGNGGFSLRSQRLLQAGLDARIDQEHPEDLMLARRYRTLLETAHGVRFAPPALARQFAFENEAPRGATFGFHGPRHLPRFVDPATLSAWLDALPDAFFRSRDARRLARALIARGLTDTARGLLHRRQRAGRDDVQTRLLHGVAGMLRWLPARGADA